MTETVTANVKSTGWKRPNVIAVEPRKTADRPVYCPVSVVPTPQGEVFKSHSVGTHAGELFPEEPEVVPAEMAKEANTEGPTNKQDLQNDRNFNRSTCTMLTTVCVQKSGGSWNWPRRPGTVVLKRSSYFWWRKFHHKLPE